MSGYRRRGVAYDPRRPAADPQRHVRASWSLPVFAVLACAVFVASAGVAPGPAPVLPAFAEEGDEAGEPQTLVVDGEAVAAGARDGFDISRFSTAPAVGRPDPGTAQAIAYDMVAARGWNEAQYSCLVALWTRESNWNVYAHNPTSGAYGIPQALPGDKMATAGADWATNPATQITWGLNYIAGRYGTPCGAWESSEARGWY